MQNNAHKVVVLGTGGTIAGTATQPGDNIGYSSAQLGAAQLVAAIPALRGVPIEVEQVAQLDSKDMEFAVWLKLAQAVNRHVSRADVQGVVITHGTDTLEETAYFLQRVLAPAKPVVLVAAMRPATSLQSDGPQNLLDAIHVARAAGARGVLAVLAGKVHSGLVVRKVHPYRLDAFSSGDAGLVAHVEEARVRRHREWPAAEPFGLDRMPVEGTAVPRVEIVTSHAGASHWLVPTLCDAGVEGIVVAGTGNGSVHHALENALLAAQDAGIAVLRCTRCLDGAVIDADGSAGALPSAGTLTPVQARIELMLRLLAQRAGRTPGARRA
jgi:L-asparaginase